MNYKKRKGHLELQNREGHLELQNREGQLELQKKRSQVQDRIEGQLDYRKESQT